MIITKPDPYLVPAYRLSPFTTANVHKNARLPNESSAIDFYLSKRFADRNFSYTYNGREAIALALGYYNLQKNDVVTIYTTTGNDYISSCVTREIEKICRWSRNIETETKVILVNHEFGYPYENLSELLKLGYPIIEDCAYTFFSEDDPQRIGHVGDFAIYSFPKFFPIQIGGLLTSKKSINLTVAKGILMDMSQLNYIKAVLSSNIDQVEHYAERRVANYQWLKDKLTTIGCKPRLPLKEGVVPGVFLFTVPGNIDLPKMKSYLADLGIQCSVFYGEQAFFIPVHHELQQEDLNYISANCIEFLTN
jgi:DegT/DnrJ/EryC1/StrS aminotransferase family